MNAAMRIRESFENAVGLFERSPGAMQLLRNQWCVADYESFLREAFHYTKENPQIQALASVHLKGEDREQVRSFLKHATSEIGHDQLALDDLQRMGADVSRIRFTRPLPATRALNSFVSYQINYDNPIGYLGYLYFLEYLPTQRGQFYGQKLSEIGIPQEAMTFLAEHVSVDVAHNKLMERYLDALVRNESDLSAVLYTLRGTAELYGTMVSAAVERARCADIDFGDDPEEIARSASGREHADGRCAA